MRLRNKKTGGIWNIPKMRQPTIQEDDISFFACDRDGGHLFSYKSLAELNEEWEDYKPAEPLIKDEKIRKAVRAWAEANGFLDEIEVHSLTAGTRFSIGHYDIEFLGYFIYDLEGNKTYDIAELCGEDE